MMTAEELIVECQSCGKSAYPALNLNDRMVLAPACPVCGTEHPGMQANDMAQTPIAPAEPKAAKAELKVVKVLPIRDSQIAKATDHIDVDAAIRNRLQFLDAELAKLAGYTAERKKLARMIADAEKTK